MDRNARLAVGLAGIVVGMVMLAYASVPLYSLFCQITGLGGTTQREEAGVAQTRQAVSDRVVTVRFNADTSPGLDWDFRSQQVSVDVAVGEERLAFFKAANPGDTRSFGTATYNVTPHKAGSYFNKVQCFCFTEQPLGPSESIDMPVSFFIDPDFLDDPDMDDVDTITLSYTFFPVKNRN